MKKYIIILLASVALLFAVSMEKNTTEEKPLDKTLKTAYFAGGCFWGVEHHFEKKKGVKDAISGYMGGSTKKPGYYDVIKGDTGHLETVKVVYDPKVVTFEELTKLFFEIHDMEQTNGQGPDIGSQYLSAVFYNNEKEKETAQSIINILTTKGYKVATSLIKTSQFYEAETYHQDYYQRTGKAPYCHIYKKIF